MYKMDRRRSEGGDRHAMPLITLTFEQFSSWRRAAGRQIDPRTAEVMWDYRLTLDPYGVCSSLPEEYQQAGREYFARAPGTDVWVAFGLRAEKTDAY